MRVEEQIQQSFAEFKQLCNGWNRDLGEVQRTVRTLDERLEYVEKSSPAGSGGSSEEVKALRRRLDELEATGHRLPQGIRGGESIGQQVVDSEAYKAFVPGSQSSSGLIAVKSFFERKANELTGASLGNVGGYLYSPARPAGIIGPPMPAPLVRDLFVTYPLSEGAIEFPRLADSTNNAAIQDEENIAAKPQSVLEFEIATATVKTLSHYIVASRQIVSDSDALRLFIDNWLVYGLGLVEDDELLNGVGGATSLTGLLLDPDVQTITQGADPSAADDNYADVIRRGITLLEQQRYSATGIVLHPLTWCAIELLKDEDGRYIWARVQETGQRRLWGLPVVCSTAIDTSNFCVADFPRAAALWTRDDATVRMSDQHSDFFVKNLVAILAEERLALTVFRPAAVVVGTFTGGGS
jgi:HK97 family phage major capsid protein